MWKLGFDKAEIMPADLMETTYYMSGYGSNKPVQGVLDPLMVRAAVISKDGFTAAFCAFDLTGMCYSDALELRTAVKSACPALDEVNLFFTHSHAAIDTMGLWGDFENGISGRNPSYMELIRNTTAAVVKNAYADLRPGRMYFGQCNARGLVGDTRSPCVTDERLTRFRFVPDEGTETSLLHFTCHPEMLGGKNTLVSADFCAEMLSVFEKEERSNALFVNGAVGGMQSGMPQYSDYGRRMSEYDTTRKIGRVLARLAEEIDTAQELTGGFSQKTEVFDIEIANLAHLAAAKAGFLTKDEEAAVASGKKKTEVSLLDLGGIKIAMLPGELFPELEKGGFLSEKDCAVPGTELEETVFDILGRDSLVFGLANDEIGYILPENDFFLDPEKPYFTRAIDRHGRRHYEETNSAGPKTAKTVLAALKRLV